MTTRGNVKEKLDAIISKCNKLESRSKEIKSLGKSSILCIVNKNMKYAERFYEEFVKYVSFKQETWYVKDQLQKWTEKQFLQQEFHSRKDEIVQKLQEHHDTPEVRYFIEMLIGKDEDMQSISSVCNFSDAIDSEYCLEKRKFRKCRFRRKKRSINPLQKLIGSESPSKKKASLVKGYVAIEKYLWEENKKDKDKVTYVSMHNLKI